jgi:tetratricopeptide (TPR) repeat protein
LRKVIGFFLTEEATKIKEETIKKAIENYDPKETDSKIKYNELIEKSQKLGREQQKFEEALDYIKKAVELRPDETMGRWGYATALHHVGRIEESIAQYEILIKQEPEVKRYKFEYGNVLLAIDLQKGLKTIKNVMEETKEFDFYIGSLGQLYLNLGLYEKAIILFQEHLKNYPVDIRILKLLAECYKITKQEKKSSSLIKKIEKLEKN